MSPKPPYLISVVGPTAIGKTTMAIQLADYFQTEIISADSRQFYREMYIGTAKPDAEEQALARHHFIDSHSIKKDYSVGKFERDALALLENLFKKYQKVIAVGGSGLYLRALWEGLDDMPKVDKAMRDQLNKEFDNMGLQSLLIELKDSDPDYYDQVDRANHQRVIRALEVIRTTGKPFSSFRKRKPVAKRPFSNVKIGLEMPRDQLFDRINQRMDAMINEGLFEEAAELYSYKHLNALQTVGYTEIFDYLDGKYDKDEAIRLLKRNSRRYAKRQMTWFKKDPEIVWINSDDFKEAVRLIESFLDT